MSSTDNSRPRVLVTGGAGYIGSHACKALAAAGYVPVTLDNLSRGHRDLGALDRWKRAIFGIAIASPIYSRATNRYRN